MINIIDDLQVVTTAIAGWGGHVIDTANCNRLVYEVRWSLSAPPSAPFVLTPLGTNDETIAPDNNPLVCTAFGLNIAANGGGGFNCSLQATGRGFIEVTSLPRFVTLGGMVSGGVSGTVTVRAYGFGV